jgi:hypothetical protein
MAAGVSARWDVVDTHGAIIVEAEVEPAEQPPILQKHIVNQ